jgi:hypothetical protein
MITQPLDVLPMWAVYPFTVVILVAAVAIGYRYILARRRETPDTSDKGMGAISGATLGMLAFLLAFVVGFGLNLYGERRMLVINEANAIGTTYLRAGYLEEPYRTESRDLLIEYVDWRLAALEPGRLQEAIDQSEEIHRELWKRAEGAVALDHAATTGLFVSSLNEVIDLHTERVAASLQIRIPAFVVVGVYVIAFITMLLVGMQMGFAPNRNIIAPVILAVVLSVVLYLIVDLDRSQQGFLVVSHQPLIDLQSSLPTLP